MVVTPVNDLTTNEPSTTFVGIGISIRTLSVPVEVVVLYNIGSCAEVRTPAYAYISHVRRYPYTRGTVDPRC